MICFTLLPFFQRGSFPCWHWPTSCRFLPFSSPVSPLSSSRHQLLHWAGHFPESSQIKLIYFLNCPFFDNGYHAHMLHVWKFLPTFIYLINDPNVGKYTIHGAYGMNCPFLGLTHAMCRVRSSVFRAADRLTQEKVELTHYQYRRWAHWWGVVHL